MNLCLQFQKLSLNNLPCHPEDDLLNKYHAILNSTYQIPILFRNILSWIPKGPIPYENLEPLHQKILACINTHNVEAIRCQHLFSSQDFFSTQLALIDKKISPPIKPSVSPLIDALYLEPPLCPTPIKNLPKNIAPSSYKALTLPKNYVDCRSKDCLLNLFRERVNYSMNFVVSPLAYPQFFSLYNQSWIKNCSITLPSQTFTFAKYAYHHPITKTPLKTLGSFSKIYSCALEKIPHRNKYIIKTIDLNYHNEIMEELLIKEATLSMVLHHPHILSCQALNTYALYFPIGTPLTEFLRSNLSPSTLRKYSFQIASALQYLHSQGFTHKDIKIDNVIIIDDKAYLIDFGLTCRTENDCHACGTPFAASPEIYVRHAPFSNKVDSWSFGIMLLECLLGHPSPLLKTQSESAFLNTHLYKPLPSNFFTTITNSLGDDFLQQRDPEDHFQKIIKGCLHGDPTERLSMQEVAKKLESIYPNPSLNIEGSEEASSEGCFQNTFKMLSRLFRHVKNPRNYESLIEG